ncbi:unnamed protein product [Urochloa humidicola]
MKGAAGDSCDLSRGRFTCYHKADAPRRDDRLEVWESIKKFYAEAARRLPLVEMPELLECIRKGGHCIGLADPVTNIILNAISRLPSPSAPDHSPPPERSHGATSCESNWMLISAQSHFGLLFFMAAYFRYLTDAQARRYLDLAAYDLSVAIKLVRHDRFTDTPHLCLLPDGGKIQAALKIAALKAGHPAPDELAGLMTMQYPSDLLVPVIRNLQGDKEISTADVWEIKSLLSNQWPPTCPFNLEFLCRPNGKNCTQGTGNDALLRASGYIAQDIFARVFIDKRGKGHNKSPDVVYISNLTFDSPDTEAKLFKCLLQNTEMGSHKPGLTVNFDAVPCDHIMSLKMCLLDTIHAFYIKALAILPSGKWGPRLLRAFLVSGHCYGPMDPVSNIVMNSIWYDITFPPLEAPASDHIELEDGILDTSPMSRLESRSLNGLVAMLRAIREDPLLEHEALEYLCLWNCNLTELCKGQHFGKIAFDSVAKAAKHPQYAVFGSFLMSLSPMMCNHLRSLLQAPAGGRISRSRWDKIKAALNQGQALVTVVPHHWMYRGSYHLSQEAELEMSRRKLAARDKLTFVREELNRMLLTYCIQHPWEPNYKVDIICGVHMKCTPVCQGKFFHANFLASSDAAADSSERTLFYAEFSESSSSEVRSELTRSSSCCPVYDYNACLGRCSFCENEASKIVHPPYANEPDGSIGRYHSSYRSAMRRVCREGFEGLLESDFIYFDYYYRDAEHVKIMNDSCMKRHTMSKSQAQW